MNEWTPGEARTQGYINIHRCSSSSSSLPSLIIIFKNLEPIMARKTRRTHSGHGSFPFSGNYILNKKSSSTLSSPMTRRTRPGLGPSPSSSSSSHHIGRVPSSLMRPGSFLLTGGTLPSSRAGPLPSSRALPLPSAGTGRAPSSSGTSRPCPRCSMGVKGHHRMND